MSRQGHFQPEKIELNALLQSLKDEYVNKPHYPDLVFEIDAEQTSINAPFDSSQLQQVLNNLIENGLRYSFKHSQAYWIKITLRYEQGKAILSLYDQGQGVSEDNQAKLFEPFFTSESSGTGLGLYLSRELCDLNQSQLSYVHQQGQQHHFQIRFAHADRDIVMKNSANNLETS